MGLITKLTGLYNRWEAGSALQMPEVESKHSITLGGTGIPFDSGNWVDSDRSGNRYSSWSNSLDYDGVAGSLLRNSAYMACQTAYQDAFSEAPAIIKKMQADGSKIDVPNHPLMEMLELVNQTDDMVNLMDGTLANFLAHGNAYWLIVSDKAGNPLELEFLPRHKVRPKTARDLGQEPRKGEPAILKYEYTADSTPVMIPVEEIVHLRLGKDPFCPWMGMGRGDMLRLEVFSDGQVMEYTAAILANMGISQQIFSPKPPPAGMTQTGFNADMIIKMIQQSRTGGRRGSSIALDMLLDIFESSVSPESMALDKIARINESRITAVTRCNSQVAGLMSGDDVKTYSNFPEARKAFWQDSVLPMMRRIRLQATRQLIWRNRKYSDRTVWFGFNYSEVPALQPDEALENKNARENYKVGGINRKELRAALGVDEIKGDENVWYSAPTMPVNEEEDPEEALLRRTSGKAYESPLVRLSAELERMEKNGAGHE